MTDGEKNGNVNVSFFLRLLSFPRRGRILDEGGTVYFCIFSDIFHKRSCAESELDCEEKSLTQGQSSDDDVTDALMSAGLCPGIGPQSKTQGERRGREVVVDDSQWTNPNPDRASYWLCKS